MSVFSCAGVSPKSPAICWPYAPPRVPVVEPAVIAVLMTLRSAGDTVSALDEAAGAGGAPVVWSRATTTPRPMTAAPRAAIAKFFGEKRVITWGSSQGLGCLE